MKNITFVFRYFQNLIAQIQKKKTREVQLDNEVYYFVFIAAN